MKSKPVQSLFNVFVSLTLVVSLAPSFAWAENATGGGSTLTTEPQSASNTAGQIDNASDGGTPSIVPLAPTNEDDVVATIGSAKYESLDDALAVVQDGETIVLHKNIKGYYPIEGKNITIDLNGKQVTAAESGTIATSNGRNQVQAFQVTGGSVTIKNGTITGANAAGHTSVYDQAGGGFRLTYWGGAVSSYSDANVTLENLTITGNQGSCIVAMDGGSLVINDCKIVENNGTSILAATSDDNYGIVATGATGSKIASPILTMTNTEVSGTTGGRGKATLNLGAAATLTNCDIKNNIARQAGGILFVPKNASEVLALTNTTVSNNIGTSSPSSGSGGYAGIGGLYVELGSVVLNNSAVYNNSIQGKSNAYATDIQLQGTSTAIIPANEMVDHGTKLDGYVYLNGTTGGILEDGIPAAAHVWNKDQYDVVKKPSVTAVWEYGGVLYNTLTDAMNAYALDSGTKGIIKLTDDTIESSTVPAIGASDSPVEVDLGGHTVTSTKNTMNAITLNGKAYINFKNGIIQKGKIGIEVKAVGSHLTLNEITIKDCARNAILSTRSYSSTSPTSLVVDNCTLQGNGLLPSYDSNNNLTTEGDTYAINWIGNFSVIDNTTITENGAGIFYEGGQGTTARTYVQYMTVAPKLENVTFSKNKGACLKSPSVLTNLINKLEVKNCTFLDNELSGGSVILLDSLASSRTLTFTDCVISGNSGSEKTISFPQSKVSATFTRCTISNNKAIGTGEGISGFPVGGIYSQASSLNLASCIIKNNTAETEYAVSATDTYRPTGGVFAYSTLSITGTGAIYNNVASAPEYANLVANDIFVAMKKKAGGPFASRMKDGDHDFSKYVWTDPNEANPITGAISIPATSTRHWLLTAEIDESKLNVAKIGETEFATLAEAFAAAKDGDTIEIIIKQQKQTAQYVKSDAITVNKKVTLDLNGIKVQLASNRFSNTLFTVHEGAELTVKDSYSDAADMEVWTSAYAKAEQANMGGLLNELVVEEGGTLNIESSISVSEITHDGMKLSIAKPLAGTVKDKNSDNQIIINLGKDKYVELGEAWDSAIANVHLLTPKIVFNLDTDVLDVLNDTNVDLDADVVLTHGGGLGMKTYSDVAGITADNVRKIYVEEGGGEEAATTGEFVLRKNLKGIYLDAVSGNTIADGGTGDIDNPVSMFEEAHKLLKEDIAGGGKAEGIIVKGAVTISNGTTATWDLSDCAGKNILYRWDDHKGNLVRVAGGGSLTLTNIIFDGQGEENVVAGEGKAAGDGSLIYVEPHGALTVGSGATLRNNYVQTKVAETSCGGAVYSAGDVYLTAGSVSNPARVRAAAAKKAPANLSTGGTVTRNHAVMGGGIYQVGKVPGDETDYTGKLIMTGGSIDNNYALYKEGAKQATLLTAGGGVMLAYGADMCFGGGSIAHNVSYNVGGGIALGTTGNAAATCLVASGTTTLSMYGNTLIDSNAAASQGGGVFVQAGAEAYIVEGTISSNIASGVWQYSNPKDVIEGRISQWSHGGGGIYVNGCSTKYYNTYVKSAGLIDYKAGMLYLNDAEIAYNKINTSGRGGGSAYAFCASGQGNLFELHGMLIHDNESPQEIDVYMTTVDHQEGGVQGKLFDNMSYYITQYTSDGTPYNWTIVDTDVFGYPTGTLSPVSSASTVQGNNIRMALRTDLSEETTDLNEAIENAKVHIVYNRSNYFGAGIGSNGSVVSGYEVPKVDVVAKKAWNDASLKSERPETVKFILQRKAENEPDSAFKDFMTAEINGQEDNWKVEWKDLPEYKEYKGSMPNSPACEDCVNGADTEDVKWEYRVVEDGTYMPDVEDSMLWTGPAYEESANGASLADIYDFETKAEEDTVRAAKDTPADYKFNDGKITVKNFTITNTPKAGKLQVSKEVVGNNADTSKEFTFKVELNTAAINGAKLNGTFGEMEFKDNVATFTLKNGETKTAENLPINVTYKVTETDYVDAGYDTTIVDNYGTTETELADGCGVIVANEVTAEGETIDNTAKVAFTNARNTYGNLTVKKVETGNATGEVKDFAFSVTLKDAAGKALANQTFGKDANALTTNANGQIEFTLAAGASKTIYSLPHGTQYEIAEASYAAQGYDAVAWTDDAGATVEKASGTIVGGTAENPRLNSSVAFTATNNRNTYGNLELTKTVAGNAADSNKEFNFTIGLAGLEPGAEYSVTGATTSTIKATAEGIAEATIGLKAGQTALVEKLPNGASYTVSEASYTEEGYASVIKGQTGAVAQGTIEGDSTASTAATDSYEFVNTRNANGSLTIAKLLQGNSIDSALDQQFNFTLEVTGTGVDDAALAQATASKTTSASSEATAVQLSFTGGKANFTLAGGEQLLVEGLPHGAAYAITETDPGADYVVTQEGATGTISETAARVATFTNTKDSFGNLAVSKTVKEYAEANKDYAFTITLSDKSISGTYGEMGFVNGVANFTLQGGQTKMAEGLPNGVGYTVAEADYSAEEYTTESTGTTGTIVGNETQTAAFTNTKHGKGSLEIKKTIAGETEGEEDREFEFRVVLDNVSVNGLYSGIAFNEGVSEPIKVKANSSKLIEGLPADAKFSVTEKDYSADRYTTTSEGSTGSIAAEKTAMASFVNTKAPEPTPTVPVRVALVKHLVDALIHVEEFSFGLYDGETLLDTVYTTLGNHVETDEYSSYVEIAFKGLRFSTAGTYNYTIREHMTGGVQVVEGDEWNLKGFEPGYYKGGVKYDDQAYPVTIVVTEDEETGQLVADVQYLGADGNKHELVNEYSEEYVEIDEYDSHPNDGLHEPTPEPEPEPDTPEKKPTPEPTKTPAKATPTTKTGSVRTADTNPVAPLTLAALAAAGTAAFAFTRRRKHD